MDEMVCDDEIRRLRHDDGERDSDETQHGVAPSDDVGITFTGKLVQITTYPSIANSYYGIQPVRIKGTEVEGGPATFDDMPGDPILAFNIGSAIPPLAGNPLAVGPLAHNTFVEVTWVPDRYEFQYDG